MCVTGCVALPMRATEHAKLPVLKFNTMANTIPPPLLTRKQVAAYLGCSIRTVINLENDEVEWLEEFDKEDQNELEEETKTAIQKATEFYDVEIAKYENDGGNN